MKKMCMAIGLAALLTACGSSQKETDPANAENPFLAEYTTPFEVPPFDRIQLADRKSVV